MNNDILFRRFIIGLIFSWLGLLAILPFVLVFIASFLQQGDSNFFNWVLTFHNYTSLLKPVFLHIFWRSFYVSLITTVCCLLIGYPFAYLLAKLPEKLRLIGLFFIIIPFWTSSLIRTYAIITVLKTKGLLNSALLFLGVIHHPIDLLYTSTASQIGLVYTLLPFMVLPIFVQLEKFDWRIVDAARDLGASKWRCFWHIVIPLSVPGILSGVLLVILPAMTLFYIPDILGGAKSMLLGNLIQSEFLKLINWPLGSAISIILALFMGGLLLIYQKYLHNKEQKDLLV